jgi:creatine kinase
MGGRKSKPTKTSETTSPPEKDRETAAEQKETKESVITTSDDAYPPTAVAASCSEMPAWIKAGLGDSYYYCEEKKATFAPDGVTPEQMPDLANHSSYMAEYLREHPEVYAKLKDSKTSHGVTLAMCIKTGVDNPGHPMIKTVGMTAGDAESYQVFKELFDPVTSARHHGHDMTQNQPTNLDLKQLKTTDIDPEGKYVLTTRVRTGRSVQGFRFPPTIAFQERRDLEALITKALSHLDGDLKGEYFPLNGSKSFASKPTGMSVHEEEALRKMGNLFQEPDSTLLLASGMGRHWPDGRGVFHNENKNLFVWVGEEDHLRIVSMQGNRENPTPEGKNIQEVFGRLVRACEAVENVFKAEGKEFVHDPILGWVLTCPSNLGTGLRAGTMVKLPQLTSKFDFKAVCKKLRLQVRGTGGVDSTSHTGGTWDISNSDRIGKGEVELVNDLIDGAAQLIKWESGIDNDREEEVTAEINALMSQ